MRRLHADQVRLGTMDLSIEQSRHARDVLRLKLGGSVEVFDSAGHLGLGVIVALEPVVQVRIESLADRPASTFELTIASAVPKGDRADWLVEKLSELGVTRWIPLQTARSVVHPEGTSKIDRWNRIAIEAAKQCKRTGTMQIDPLTPLAQVISGISIQGYFGSTFAGAGPLVMQDGLANAIVLIGPEGGWTPEEEQAMTQSGLTPVTLGDTILRIETAALAAAVLARHRTLTSDL